MSQSFHEKAVLNTRPFHQSYELNKALSAKGIHVVPLPTMEIRPAQTNWQAQVGECDQYHKLIFTSTNAVYFAFQHLPRDLSVYRPDVKFFAIGEATANALRKAIDIEPIVPNNTVSEGMLEDQSLLNVAHENIAIFKGVGGRTLLRDTLIDREGNVLTFSTYQRCRTDIDPAYIDDICSSKCIDIILVTSGESFDNLMTFFPKDSHVWLFDLPVVTFSERIGALIKEKGFRQIVLTRPTHLVETILNQ